MVLRKVEITVPDTNWKSSVASSRSATAAQADDMQYWGRFLPFRPQKNELQESEMTTVRSCWFAVALLLFLPAVCEGEDKSTFTESGHTTDNLKKVKRSLAKGTAVLLDVRELNEWKAGHLKQANLLPLSIIRKGKKLLRKDKPVYCHCRSGGRVLAVSKILRSRGYDIRPLKAGYTDLLQAGFEKAK
jgi:phage shock protein E